jgi:hypothetical protein
MAPGGKFIAALDIEKQQWHRLATGISGNDLIWSSDSQFIHASVPFETPPGIVRISIRDRKKNRQRTYHLWNFFLGISRPGLHWHPTTQ